MKHAFLLLMILLVHAFASAQTTPDTLKTSFLKSLADDYSEKEMSDFFRLLGELSVLSMPEIKELNKRPPIVRDTTALLEAMKKDFPDTWQNMTPGLRIKPLDIGDYELQLFKNDTLYRNNISRLYQSSNMYQRAIAYELIERLIDTVFSNTIVSKMQNEKNELCSIRACYAATQIARKETTKIFDYIIDHEDFGDAHLLPMYLSMDTLSIINTSYERLSDKRKFGRICALQSMAMFDHSEKAGSIILKALNEWPDDEKGYAIAALGMNKSKKLKQYLEPYASNPKLKKIIIRTLQESDSREDKKFADELEKKS